MCITQALKKPDPSRGPAPWTRAAGNGKKPAARGPRLTAVECDVLVVRQRIIGAIITDDAALFIRSPIKRGLVAIVAVHRLAIRTEVSVLLAIVRRNAVDKKPATKRGISIAFNTQFAHCPSPRARMAKSPAAKATLKSPRPTQIQKLVRGFFQTAYLYSSFMIECSHSAMLHWRRR